MPTHGLEGFRISVRLDAGLPVEALIVKRLIALPKRRHQDWIRALLIQGFVAESRVHRQVQIGLASPASGSPPAEKPVALPTSAYANWRREPATRQASSGRVVAERTPPAPTGCLKCPTEGVGEDLYPLWKLALEPAEAFAYDTVKSQKGLTKTSSGMMLSVGAVDGFLMGELKLNEDELSDGYAALDLKL